MNAKTINGFTFQQLHSLDIVMLNEIQSVLCIAEIRKNIVNAIPVNVVDKLLYLMQVRLEDLFNRVLDEKMYAGLKQLYDTEERFDITADMMATMGSISAMIIPLMHEVQADMMKMLEAEES
jgi:hypothetical protein